MITWHDKNNFLLNLPITRNALNFIHDFAFYLSSRPLSRDLIQKFISIFLLKNSQKGDPGSKAGMTRGIITPSLFHLILKPFLLFLLLHTSCFSLDGQDAQRFVEAGEQYKQGHYQEAYRMYQEISKPTPRVYFNLGNCAFKLEQNGRALWHWKQAEERWGLFDREDLDNNITLIKEKLALSTNKNPEKPLPILFNKIQSCVHGFPLLALQLIFLILWTLLFVYAKKLLKRKRRSLVGLLGACVFITGGILLYRHIHAMRLHGVVIESKAILYSGPSTTYQQIGFLPEGLAVNIERQRQDFYKIRTKGQFGWVAHTTLGVI